MPRRGRSRSSSQSGSRSPARKHRRRNHSQGRERERESQRHKRNDTDRPRHRDRDRDRERSASPVRRALPQGIEPLTESDYFQKNDEFRVWLKEDRRKVRSFVFQILSCMTLLSLVFR